MQISLCIRDVSIYLSIDTRYAKHGWLLMAAVDECSTGLTLQKENHFQDSCEGVYYILSSLDFFSFCAAGCVVRYSANQTELLLFSHHHQTKTTNGENTRPIQQIEKTPEQNNKH